MESDGLTTLVTGISAQAPQLCRVGLSVLAVLRFGALAFGGFSLWRDEIGDFACNSTAESCRLSCFDDAFPISPFNLFLLLIAGVRTHSLASFCLFHPTGSQGKGRWWHTHGKSQQLQLHLITILARILLEAIFLIVFHGLYKHYPHTLYCAPSIVCPQTLLCTIRKSNWKDTFILFVTGTSWVSVMLCLIALYTALIKIHQHTSYSTKNKVELPLLAHSA